tara:strand:- start:215 stop:571 length:357 start_codon:yes stop_codon:yes gene_type:complete
MAKKIDGYIKLQIAAGKANPSPPVGPALGQRGVNIMEFCKAFNAATQQMEPASYFLRKAAGIAKGSGTTGKGFVGKVTKAQVKEIAEAKMVDLNAHDLTGAMSMIEGSARAMGLEVVE